MFKDTILFEEQRLNELRKEAKTKTGWLKKFMLNNANLIQRDLNKAKVWLNSCDG